jgi:hypothetical protein
MWSSPLLRFVRRVDHADEYQVLGADGPPASASIMHEGNVSVDVEGARIFLRPMAHDALVPYTISMDIGGTRLSASGTLTGGTWDVKVFPSPCDPREDVERWRREGLAGDNVQGLTADVLDFKYAHAGVTELFGLPVSRPHDHFGTIATRTLTFPPGRWRLRTSSDDGIRVWLDEALAIDDWTWHAPKEHIYEFEVKDAKAIDLRIEHFELDGYANVRGFPLAQE